MYRIHKAAAFSSRNVPAILKSPYFSASETDAIANPEILGAPGIRNVACGK
jgi:hypothetical protein